MQRRALLTELTDCMQEVNQLQHRRSVLGSTHGSAGQQAEAHPAVKKALVAAPAVVQVSPTCMHCTGSTASGGIMQAASCLAWVHV